MDVPTIDLRPFIDGSNREGVVRAVSAACAHTGFIIVASHGLPQHLLRRAFDETKEFFDQPPQVKAQFTPTAKGQQRGYHGVATRNLARTTGQQAPDDLRELIFLGPVQDHGGFYGARPEALPAYAPNILPTIPDAIDATLVALYRAFESLSADLFRIFALALALPEDFFIDKMNRHFSIMACHHYPPLREPPQPGQLRAGAHTDFGAMTILAMTDALGGLQARSPDGQWIPVTARADEFVINLGDLMARWTNDRWQSTLHRVVNPPGLSMATSERQSIGFFVHPNDDAPIRCFDSCLATGETPHYPPVTAGEHIRLKIERSHIHPVAA